jgi:hypothetical protein
MTEPPKPEPTNGGVVALIHRSYLARTSRSALIDGAKK